MCKRDSLKKRKTKTNKEIRSESQLRTLSVYSLSFLSKNQKQQYLLNPGKYIWIEFHSR